MCTGCCSVKRKNSLRWSPPCQTDGSLSRWEKETSPRTRSPIPLSFSAEQRCVITGSDWSLQLVSVGYGRTQKSEFLLIVSREVKGEESCQTHPAHSGEVCPSIPRYLLLCGCTTRSAHHTLLIMYIFSPLHLVIPVCITGSVCKCLSWGFGLVFTIF